MTTITRNSTEYMNFFNDHKMYSHVCGSLNVAFSEIISEGVAAMLRFNAEKNLENLKRVAAIQSEQRFFIRDLELEFAENNIQVLDEDLDELDIDFDEF